ncbi:hypothetical protein JCM8208_005891, partial [Rhodotorula glutinis]
IGRPENIVGWYHSHPGYGCWLSGIDVMTQKTNQQFQDPFLAVVIDPNRTVSAGKVEIGAFRTYPEGYTPAHAAASEYQSIPQDKIDDFGVHAASYYPLDVSHFKSSHDAHLLDLLWNKYWVMTLSQSPLVTNRAYATSQLSDLVAKLRTTDQSVAHRCNIGHLSPLIVQLRQQLTANKGSSSSGEGAGLATPSGKGKARADDQDQDQGDDAPGSGSSSAQAQAQAKKDLGAKLGETQLARVVRDATKLSSEASHGLVGALVKDALFNGGRLAKAGGGGGGGGEGGAEGGLKLPPVVL